MACYPLNVRPVSEYKVDEIIDGIKTRDSCVLQFIYKNYYPSIRNFVLNNSGSEEDAKDIFQESIIIIYRKVKEQEHLLISSSFKFQHQI